MYSILGIIFLAFGIKLTIHTGLGTIAYEAFIYGLKKEIELQLYSDKIRGRRNTACICSSVGPRDTAWHHHLSDNLSFDHGEDGETDQKAHQNLSETP